MSKKTQFQKELKNEARETADELAAQVEKLQAFKDFVHRRLDEMGIEPNPDGPHSKEGCRIGDRLDLVQQGLTALGRWQRGELPVQSRELESMTDEEAQECLGDVFLVPPHAAYISVDDLKKYLCDDTEPLADFAVTPQTYFNLTRWLLSKGFNIYGV